MTEEQGRLSMGVSFLVRESLFRGSMCSMNTSYNESYRTDYADNTHSVSVKVTVPHPYGADIPERPPLSDLQTLALSVLIDPTTASTSALIDAMIGAGLVDPDAEQVIRADERERVAKMCDAAVAEWNATAYYWRERERDNSADRCEGRASGASCIADKIRRGDV